jgi:ABC-type sugar transport system substrate-binding protein
VKSKRNTSAGDALATSRRAFLGRSAMVAGGFAAAGVLSACTTASGSSGGGGGGGGGSAGEVGNSAYHDAITKLVDGRTLSIGFTPPIISEFHNQVESAAFGRMAELEEAYGVKWEWEKSAPTGNFDAVEQQVRIVQTWASRKLNAIVVCTGANFATMQNVYTQAAEGGSNMFQYNQPVELYNTDDIRTVSNIGYDNIRQSGFLAGRFIGETLGGEGKIIQIMGPSGSDWSKARQQGFDLAMKEFPGLEVVGSADGGYVRDKGQTAAQDLLTRSPDINAIYGENEDMALGASQAVDAQGLKQWDGSEGIVIVGADGVLSGMQAIRDGKLTASIDVGSVDQGRAIIDTIFHSVLLGDVVDRVINIPTRVVTKDNVDAAEAYIQWGNSPAKTY